MNALNPIGFAMPTASGTLRLRAEISNSGLLQIGTGGGVTFVNLVSVIAGGNQPSSLEATAIDAALARIDARSGEDVFEWSNDLAEKFAGSSD